MINEPIDDRHPVEALAEEFVARHRRGERPSVTEYANRYPHWAADIRLLFPAASLLEELKGASTPARPGVPEHLGDFRIIREIGRGGMGIVYEAEQVSLNRRVAVKVLPQTSLTAEQLARFRREAQAAGRLHHSNIVPIFGVGEQDGLHYYVMQYIAGEGLDRLIVRMRQSERRSLSGLWKNKAGAGEAASGAQKPLPESEHAEKNGSAPPTSLVPTEAFEAVKIPQENHPCSDATSVHGLSGPNGEEGLAPGNPAYYRSATHLILQVADALAYAHGQGVLHRDIKPANLLLDEQGVVWITDFGLAKLLEEADLTRPGEMAGTLRYCAPERFKGRSDARSDLYALGLTFFELLTLRPAYGAMDPGKLIQQLLQGQYTTPRSLEPNLPRDLETVLLKLLAPEPERRYGSAEELAEDLRLFLADRPVRARRASLVTHAVRWCRRNPAIASLSLALVVSVMLGYALVGWQWGKAVSAANQAREALVSEEKARAQAEVQQQRAEGNLNLALEAFERIAGGLAPSRPAAPLESGSDEPGSAGIVSPEAATILQDLVRFYERFATDNTDDTRLKEGAAQALRLVGSIRFRLSEYGPSETVFRQAAQLLGELDATLELAQVHNDLGVVLRSMGRLPAARSEHEQARRLLEALTDDPAARLELARAHNLQGSIELRQLKPAQSEASQRLALQHLERLLAEDPENAVYRHTLARVYNDLSLALFARAPGEAFKARTQTQSLLEKLVREYPAVAQYRADLAELLVSTGPRPLMLNTKARQDQENRFQQALKLSEGLVDQYPAVPDYQALLGRTRTRLGQAQAQAGKTSEAYDQLRRAVDLQEELVRRFPRVPTYTLYALEARLSLGEVLRQRGDLTTAEKVLRELKQDLQKQPLLMPRNLFGRGLFARSLRALGLTLLKQGKKEEAEQLFKQAEKYEGRK